MATGCDTFVALGNSTITKSTIFAKNSDRPKDECQTLIEVPRLNHETNSIVKCQFIEIPQSAPKGSILRTESAFDLSLIHI